MMGDQEIVVDDKNNIYIHDGADIFKGTRALWRLIMLKTPDTYEPEDLEEYKRLVTKTNVIDMPHRTSTSDRPKTTAKWRCCKEIGLVPGENEDNDNDDDEDDEEDEVDFEDAETKKEGSGISFLPGDIKGLIEKFRLLVAEHRAGNKSLKNQIVAILDKLLRLNYLSQEEYKAVSRTISS